VSRNRIAVAVAVLVIFVVVGGILIYATRSHGGQNLTFNVTVTKATTMSPSNLPAHQNDTVTINFSSDTDGEVHLHVYDIAFETKAGQTVSHTFKADKTCTCDIEWESTSTALGTLTVSP
jgi:cytochrome c oxidase assembly protein Cox11